MPWQTIAAAITKATGQPFDLIDQQPASGGCINQAAVLDGRDGRRFFVKLNGPDRLAMFQAEAEGLGEILASHTLLAPTPICAGVAGHHAYLALEYLELGDQGSDVEFAHQLAAMHRHGHTHYGWHRDNTIGSTPQPNTPDANWVEFWRHHRLGQQLDLARQGGAPASLLRKGERLLSRLDAFLAGHHPVPSLLHGDLWGGNYGFAGNRPVIFDPAVYFGDREVDLAMTELFGGFSARFYAAYREAWPLDAGYTVRKTLYNLYHVLNHFNMFGGYAGQAEAMHDRLLAELG
jgi:fructosamine-3-kinase